MIATWYRDSLQRLRQRANVSIRRAAGLSKDPPARCDDPKVAYSDVHGVTRIVHGDLPSMLVGGVGSLFFQMLHPLAMAGVAQHSRYQDDPFGRLLQTANFIGATTFGSKESAHVAIERVLNVHQFVHGVGDDGRAYDANDPHLLLWVHCTELFMFLNSYQRFGAQRLSDARSVSSTDYSYAAPGRCFPRGHRSSSACARVRSSTASSTVRPLRFCRFSVVWHYPRRRVRPRS